MTQPSLFPQTIVTYRDVRLFQINPEEVIVVACDSLGAIGPKPLDKVKVNGYTVGKFTARVALMEVLAVGAKPICIVDNLCLELHPTGEEILRGVKDEAVAAGLDPELAVTGSSEKNFAVEQTGVGVTVIGICKKASLKIGISKPSDAVVMLGYPCLGNEVVVGEQQGIVCDIADLQNLLSLQFIHEVIPVGSMGAKREIECLNQGLKLNFSPTQIDDPDLTKSAGPSTVLLATLPVTYVSVVAELFNGKPFKQLGTLFQQN